MDRGVIINVNQLETEYNTAIAKTQMTRQWYDLQDNNVAYYEYSTAGDNKVRAEHERLDGLTMLADSPAWKAYWPPLDWNCRCTIIPGVASKAVDAVQGGRMLKSSANNPLFANNTAEQNTVIERTHPYYRSLEIDRKTKNRKVKPYTAVGNYGLEKVEEIIKGDLSKIEKGASVQSFNDFWNTLKKNGNTDDVVIKDNLGINVLFPSNPTPGKKDIDFFKQHIFLNNERRWEYAHMFPEVIEHPDEIWSVRGNDAIVRAYLRFYEDGPLLIYVKDAGGLIKAESIYLLKKERYEDFRIGALLYKKR